MTETTGMSAEQRRAQLEAELARIEAEEKRLAEEARLAAQQEHEATLPPEQREQKAEIERRAKEQLDREFPPAWNPQKPDSNHPDEIVGLVLRIDPRVGPSATFGTYSAVVEVKTTAGAEWTVWCNESGALYAQLTRLRVQPGEVIAIRYRGKKDSQTNPGQSYHDFRLVRVDDEDGGPAAPVDYDALERSRNTPELPETTAASSPPAAPDDDIPF